MGSAGKFSLKSRYRQKAEQKKNAEDFNLLRHPGLPQ